MPKPTYVQLNSITLAATSSLITFSNIPQNFRDLVLIISGSGASQYRLNPNGDTGNASLVYMDGYGTSVASGTATQISLWYDSSTGNSLSINHIMDYSATDKHKMVLTRGTTPGTAASAYSSRWASTAAITSLNIVNASSGILNIGSNLTLYGIEA